MSNREIYLSERAAESAAWSVITRRTIKGATPLTRPAMRQEKDRSLSRGFVALVKLMDGAVLPLERLA